MSGKITSAWMGLGIDAWSLSMEASFTAGLRLAQIATGGVSTATETQRMVSEKIQAAVEMQAKAASGKLGATPLQASRAAVKHYRRKVAANRRRLSR